MSGLEKEIESACMSYLRYRGFYCQKVHSGAMMKAGKDGAMYRINLADKGTPDIFACIMGRMICIEVKESPEEVAEWKRQWEKHLETQEMKDSWERSIYQHVEQAKWRNCGAEIIIVSSVQELESDIAFLINEYEKRPL